MRITQRQNAHIFAACYLATFDMDGMPATRRLMQRSSNIGLMDALTLPQNAVVEGVVPPQQQLVAYFNATAVSHCTPKPGPGELPAVKRFPESRDIESSPTPLQTLAGPDALDTDTRRLIGRFFSDFTGLSKSAWNQSKALSTLKRVVTMLVDKHRFRYNGIINTLSLERRGCDMTFISKVAKNLFADGVTSWGRIASLVAVGAVVSQALKEKQQASCVELVAHEVSTYLLSHQRTWLVQHNAWDGFVEFFKEHDLESTVRNVLLAFVGLASGTAVLLRFFK
ncbi:induced myeloid leukemia cell differentiation protein Mcl-1-like [Festucalex cinctus]